MMVLWAAQDCTLCAWHIDVYHPSCVHACSSNCCLHMHVPSDGLVVLFLLLQDVINEAAKWGGKVLLHQEVALPAAAGRSTGGGAIAAGAAGGQQQPGGAAAGSFSSGRVDSISSRLPAPLLAGSFLTPPAGPVAPAAVKLAGVMPSPAAPALASAVADSPAAMRVSGSQILVGAAAAAEAAGSITDNAAGEVITAPVDVRPGAAVVPFWETVDLEALGLRRSGSGTGRVSSSGGSGGGSAAAGVGNNAVGAGDSSSTLPLGTCLEVAKALQAKGLHITYRRIPLSRERTPVPSDLSDMLKQMLALPAGVGPLDKSAPGGGASPNAAAMMKEAAAAAAAWGSTDSPWSTANAQQQQKQDKQQQQQQRSIVHLVVSRTATGSSARFASAAFATFLAQHTPSESRAAASGASNSPTLGQGSSSSSRRHGGAAAAHADASAPAGMAGSRLVNGAAAGGAAQSTGDAGGGGGASSDGGSPKSPAAKRLRRTCSDLGEYRVIMSLVRLLPGGMEIKDAVDSAIDRCSAIGNLRADIAVCKHAAEAAPQASSNDPGSTAWAARQLGVHYLKRYFLLIAFRWVHKDKKRNSNRGVCSSGHLC